MLLGCIGDDFTGSSDLANTLAKQGMRTVQYTGVPEIPADAGIEAGVVALKSRTLPVKQAVEQSLEALRWLRDQGCEQFFFKYCSTFDSTKQGNIGPVSEALADALDARKVIVCPAFPGTGRSVYQGHLFVNDKLLNESGMQSHPLTPMIDADIRRWLAYQSHSGIGHVPVQDVMRGAAVITERLDTEVAAGGQLIVVDAITDEHLLSIGEAAAGLLLVTGGSGVALGLPANFIKRGLIAAGGYSWKGENGKCVVLSGSCSMATREQVSLHQKSHASFEITAAQVIENQLTPKEVADWLLATDGIPLAYSSADPEVVRSVQATFGTEKSAQALEAFFADVADRLVAGGVSRIVTAGGETSGAVVESLALDTLQIGPEIDPGVPALRAGDNLVVALKSGNFGAPDFFTKAASVLEQNS